MPLQQLGNGQHPFLATTKIDRYTESLHGPKIPSAIHTDFRKISLLSQPAATRRASAAFAVLASSFELKCPINSLMSASQANSSVSFSLETVSLGAFCQSRSVSIVACLSSKSPFVMIPFFAYFAEFSQQQNCLCNNDWKLDEMCLCEICEITRPASLSLSASNETLITL